ncbi:hypothetical protein ACIQVT_08885 [Streptomyces sp. NPDC100445]|uniref:hypothetical protein n=1 Tax=Streptomyces sp. NPDC100445 TaxID=3366102 RepID=UPI0037F15CF6
MPCWSNSTGLPYRHIGRAFRVSPSTTWRWAQRGTELWHRGGDPEALAAALAALRPLDELKDRAAVPRPPQRPAAAPLPEDPDEAFAVWAQARFGVDPEDLAELLETGMDCTGLEDAMALDADQLAALLDDLPDEEPAT